MAKSFDNNVFDNGLNYVVNNVTKMTLTKGIPASFTDANNLASDTTPGIKVAEVTMAPGDFTVQDRTGGGRECVVAAKSGVTALDSTTTEDLHVTLLDMTNSLIVVLTDEITNQAITSGNTINFPSFTFGMGDPV